MAVRILFVATFLAAVILAPIHKHFEHTKPRPTVSLEPRDLINRPKEQHAQSYLWTHLVFVYVFTGLVFYFLLDQTQDIVHVRQNYLGSQSTVTDRTIKLSGIPEELRSEGTLKEYIEKLKIGRVERLTICRDWRALDKLMEERRATLRKLEEAHTVYGRVSEFQRNSQILPVVQPERNSRRGDESTQPLLDEEESHHFVPGRPKTTVRKSWFDVKGKKVDAIDYLTMKLQQLDDKITAARRKEYRPLPVAFVTMDSVPSAQVAIQALLDPTPGVMIARQAPAPSDIIWKNTYLSRRARCFRHWSISISVSLLSLFWLVPVAALAVLWDLGQIKSHFPTIGTFLEDHEIYKSLLQNFVPTLVLTLLNVAIPYFYDWLCTYQGMLSSAEIELSTISKNFFFTFFNLFFAFTVFGTAFTFKSFWDNIRDGFRDATKIAYLLADSLEKLNPFYSNLILLQGLGIFPLRLLQIGSVFQYPITKYGAKTPRDFDELVQPAIFKYGFFLPQPILIFIICIVYSVLKGGVYLLFFGLLYFILGYFTYKYQLLYAMEHTEHSTGRAWPLIVHRIILGLCVFQVSMAGWLALNSAYTRGGLVLPLLLVTGWAYFYYDREYLPSSRYIALKSVRERGRPATAGQDEEEIREIAETEGGGEATVDEERERGMRFENPSLVDPLESLWIPSTVRDDHDGGHLNGL